MYLVNPKKLLCSRFWQHSCHFELAVATLDEMTGQLSNRHALLNHVKTHSGAEVEAGAEVHSSDCGSLEWPTAGGETSSGLSWFTLSTTSADVTAAADGLAAVCSAISLLEDANIL